MRGSDKQPVDGGATSIDKAGRGYTASDAAAEGEHGVERADLVRCVVAKPKAKVCRRPHAKARHLAVELGGGWCACLSSVVF